MVDKRLILIGSTGRNSGKTTIACRIIKHFAAKTAVYALKVTGIDSLGTHCPRHGGDGCGACSITNDFCLSAETNPGTQKDTSLLLAAGAREVWWLRSLRSVLERGYTAFRSTIPEDALVIAESNSLRRAVQPALFIMLRDETTTPKQTALDVMNIADITLPAMPDKAAIEQVLNAAASQNNAKEIGLTGASLDKIPHWF
ncbi:MAG: hypothetical protein LBG72_10680 [Spirochaetaceae bacterium]|jgi:hypothetical protein|nr:hypothetical protein [Spirochaetaceae bacterium]